MTREYANANFLFDSIKLIKTVKISCHVSLQQFN